jgi:hypothetical protein
MENKILLDYIVAEQEKRMKVSKVQGNEVELTDPQKPGVKTTIDTSKVDVDVDKQTNAVNIKTKAKNGMQVKPVMRPGQQVSMEDLDDEARNFVDYIQDQGYKIDSMGAGMKGINIQYTTRDGETHQVHIKR